MKYEFVTYDPGEIWETSWHLVLLTKDEVDRLFLGNPDTTNCWQRKGGDWIRCSSNSYGEILRPEVDEWLRENCGHEARQIWECDRFYYPHETLPELPKSGSRQAWKERFICYPDRDGTYESGGWSVSITHQPGFRRKIAFRDNNGEGQIKATLFAMLFM
jgi:hypothetical protein